MNVLVDVSQSVDLDGAIESLAKVDEWIKGLRASDTWSLFAVASGVRQYQSTAELRDVLKKWQTGLADDKFRSDSKLAEALPTTRLVFPADKSRRTRAHHRRSGNRWGYRNRADAVEG